MHLQQIFRTSWVLYSFIYHRPNRCRCQNTTPKNLLSNMFPFTSKKKRKTGDSSSSLLFFHLIELHPALAFGNLRFKPAWPLAGNFEGASAGVNLGKKHGKPYDTQKHMERTSFRDSKKAFRKNDSMINCVLICEGYEILRHSNSTSTSDTEAAQI